MASLVSLTDYKSLRGITVTTWDTRLTGMLAAASAMVRRWCGRDESTGFESGTTRTEYIDGTNGPTLQVREWPIVTLTSVSELDASGTATDLASTDYRAENRTGILARHTSAYGRFTSMNGVPSVPYFQSSPRWCGGFQNWKVIYTGGFATIPADLQEGVCKITDSLFAQLRKDMAGLQSEDLGDYGYVNRPIEDYEEALKSLAAPFIAHYMTGNL